MKKVLILFFVFGLLNCTSLNNNKIADDKIEKVSIISIISTPKKYHNKKIAVKGYYTLETEGYAIYFSKNDYEKNIFKNGLCLYASFETLKELGIEEPYKGYVSIEGVFNKNILGSHDLYSGSIQEITKIERLYKKGSLSDEYDDE